MPPSNPEPAHTALPVLAAESSSGGTNTHAIIIGVSVGAGCLVLLVTGYKVWKSVTRRSKAPLPPKGPLAHDRQRQITPAYHKSEENYPHPMEVPPRTFAPFTGVLQSGDHARQTSDRTDDSSVPPSPSVVSSQMHLVQTPSGSEENGEMMRSSHASFSGSSTVRHYHHGQRQRTHSTSGSVNSTRSRQSSTIGNIRGRGPPHARHSRVDVVLPQPLAPGFFYASNASRQSQLPPHSRGSSRERRPESREGYASTQTSMDSPPIEMFNHAPGKYPPPVPPLPTNYHAITSPTISPTMPSPLASEVVSPTSAAPFLSQPAPSPERGPPPLPPPKDSPPRSSRRARGRSESTYRN